jgi:muramidase (phage lysozyme)
MFRVMRHILIRLVGLAWLALAPAASLAEPGLAGRFADRGPMFGSGNAPLVARRAGPAAPRGSLFAGRGAGTLIGERPGHDLLGRSATSGPGAPMRARLRDLIARAEAGPAGYDALQGGAHRPSPRRPTRMSLREIFDWIDATPGQHHAIGRYQIIPATLRRMVARAGLDPGTRFDPAVQDRLADLPLADAGLDAVRRGEITLDKFLLNLAKVWAGLPTPSGRSYYHGVAGNRAVLSYDSYTNAVDEILGG